MLAVAILLGVIVVAQLIMLAWITVAQEKSVEVFARSIAQIQADHASQVNGLLQRIQAPEAAIVQYQMEHLPDTASPASIPFEDDEAFHATREELAAVISANLSE